eukprot:COSAG01_NODE_4090_length_5360_cov_26.230184_1_plen_31_part_10
MGGASLLFSILIAMRDDFARAAAAAAAGAAP